jgi:pyruvate/2-oxoglutarate dehydrogenase complex dihydrolipoamide dehydrogenase (E3) component
MRSASRGYDTQRQARERPCPAASSSRTTCGHRHFIEITGSLDKIALIPPLGRAGLTEAQVRKSGRRALIGRLPMTEVGRAVEKGETQGLMKIIVDGQTHEILGAAILGTGGDEAIHSILDVMYAKAPYTVIRRAVHIHPTVSELIPTMLGELQPLAETSSAALAR